MKLQEYTLYFLLDFLKLNNNDKKIVRIIAVFIGKMVDCYVLCKNFLIVIVESIDAESDFSIVAKLDNSHFNFQSLIILDA